MLNKLEERDTSYFYCHKKKNGFTLTEVLVVVLIIGVITAIAYPVYTKTINKSRAVEALNLLDIVRTKQIANQARYGDYLPNFTNIGQLTGNQEVEVKSSGDAILTIGKYEMAMNNATNCMSSAYIPSPGKPASFTFSASYEESGLGCDGSICKSFGNIVGDVKSVCNCGDKTCSGNFNLNPKTCSCDCALECNSGGVCRNKTLNVLMRQACGNGGTQSRSCKASCEGGTCSGWGPCNGQSCSGDAPPTTRPCGNKCGVESATLSCNDTTATWMVTWGGTCSGEGACIEGETEECGNGGVRRCSAACGWDACENEGCTPGTKEHCSIGILSRDGERICQKDFTFGECNPIGMDCHYNNKPTIPEPRACSNCGKQEVSVECDYDTAIWQYKLGECKGQKEETAACDAGFVGVKSRICTDNIFEEWDISACVCQPNSSFVSGSFPGSTNGQGGCKCNDGYEGIPMYGETCKPVKKWTHENKSYDTIISGCSGANPGNVTICTGSVVEGAPLYTAHQLTRCDNRAKGNGFYSAPTKGDGSKCNDTNAIETYSGGNSNHQLNPKSLSCSGVQLSLAECSGHPDELCKQRGYEGPICVMVFYSTGCQQIGSVPCYQNGDYCYYLGGGSSDWRRIATKGAAMVAYCKQE